MEYETLSLEERILRLEAAIPKAIGTQYLSSRQFLLSFVLAFVASTLAFKGMGEPNHPYQIALAILTVALAYHRRWFRFPSKTHQWAIAAVNCLTLAMINKLLIGSGVRQPFYWAQLPTVSSWNLQWAPVALASWEVDLTLIQTFLLLVTLIGALFRFQPFVSLTALLLIVVSVPAFAGFQWQWVFPALAASAVAFYIQSSQAKA